MVKDESILNYLVANRSKWLDELIHNYKCNLWLECSYNE